MPTLLALVVLTLGARPDPGARAILDSAAARMGGADQLRAIQRVKVESMTEWQSLSLDDRPRALAISYERSTEWRDYGARAWRYLRRFATGQDWVEITDLVVDSVAAMRVQGVWQPQNVAYVAEREEWFAVNPDRLILAALDDPTAKSLPDTTIGGRRYRRVRATINHAVTTIHVGARDGLLSLATFRAAQPKDGGLAPWGEMDVAIWYSRWQALPAPSRVALPTQLDVFRVGRPYKRVMVLSTQPNPDIPADSLVVTDSIRTAFLARGNKGMFDLPVDTAKIVDGRFAVFGPPGTPTGAVKVGGKWLVLDGGSIPPSIERSVGFLAKADPATPVAGALLAQHTANGGLAWLAEKKMKVWVTESAQRYADAVAYGWHLPKGFTTGVRGGSWLPIGTDSLRVETIDLPDYPNATVLYLPNARWVFASMAFSPPALARVQDLIRRRGWTVDRVASSRRFPGDPLPPT